MATKLIFFGLSLLVVLATAKPVPTTHDAAKPVPTTHDATADELKANNTTLPGAPEATTMSEKASDTAASSDTSSRCFPAKATVELGDGSKKQMGEIELGDLVRVQGGSYSRVFMFTHKLYDAEFNFVHIITDANAEIVLTHGHYLKVNGLMKPASTVRRGDLLEIGSSGDHTPVIDVREKKSVGLFNPQTVDGSIVVNGLVASTYTTAVEINTAHTLLAPVRAIYNWFGLAFRFLESGSAGLANLLPNGKSLY